MDITDSKNNWRLTCRPGLGYQVEHMKHGSIKSLSNVPSDSVMYMHERTFVRKCQTAFQTGEWPN